MNVIWNGTSEFPDLVDDCVAWNGPIKKTKKKDKDDKDKGGDDNGKSNDGKNAGDPPANTYEHPLRKKLKELAEQIDVYNQQTNEYKEGKQIKRLKFVDVRSEECKERKNADNDNAENEYSGEILVDILGNLDRVLKTIKRQYRIWDTTIMFIIL